MNFDGILFSTEIDDSSPVGAKAKNLKRLCDLGLKVPKFLVLDAKLCSKLLKDLDLLSKASDVLKNYFNGETLSIRSSAFIEDQPKNSLAGQFKTILNVPAHSEQIANAILEILTHAQQMHASSEEDFAIIVQSFIEPDIAGVTFTRNPLGGQELIIEWACSRGDALVAGMNRPNRLALNRIPELADWPQEILILRNAVENFRQIEVNFQFPQDIEWCIKNNEIYFLQSRPITAMASNSHETFRYLDEALAGEKFYCFAKTEISEASPRPTPMTLDLLKEIYSPKGPVQSVYHRFHINYRDTKFLKIFGNELYIDRELEIQSLLPAFSFKKSQDGRPRFSGFAGILFTLKNLFWLNMLTFKLTIFYVEKLISELKESINSMQMESNLNGSPREEFKARVAEFKKSYALIFKINLLASQAQSSIARLAFDNSNNIAEILANIEIDEHFSEIKTKQLKGNSLELSDESEFIGSRIKKNLRAPSSASIFLKKFSLQQQYRLRVAAMLMKAREMGRWLSILHINKIRHSLFEVAKENAFSNVGLIYFATLREVEIGQLAERTLAERKVLFDNFNYLTGPKILSEPIFQISKTLVCISAGHCDGRLVDEIELQTLTSNSDKVILYTETLSPHLAQHFSLICGIVANRGGMLSHLAILAREYGIPAVVNFIPNENIKVGSYIKLDATEARISQMTEPF